MRGDEVGRLYLQQEKSPNLLCMKKVLQLASKSLHQQHHKNIAKGTTDPRVEFCLPKLLILVISQGQTQNLIKFHLQNIDQAPTSKSRHQQTSVSRLNLKFKILTKPGFRISTKIHSPSPSTQSMPCVRCAFGNVLFFFYISYLIQVKHAYSVSLKT